MKRRFSITGTAPLTNQTIQANQFSSWLKKIISYKKLYSKLKSMVCLESRQNDRWDGPCAIRNSKLLCSHGFTADCRHLPNRRDLQDHEFMRKRPSCSVESFHTFLFVSMLGEAQKQSRVILAQCWRRQHKRTQWHTHTQKRASDESAWRAAAHFWTSVKSSIRSLTAIKLLLTKRWWRLCTAWRCQRE